MAKEKKQKTPKINPKREGRRVRSISPMSKVSPYIMKARNDATNLIFDSINSENADNYIYEKRNAGLKSFGMLHLFLAAYVRLLSQMPEMNRFIRGQKVYSRNCIEIMITIKLEMKVNAPDTVVKLFFPPDATAEEVYQIVIDAVNTARTSESSFDDTARILNYIPGILLKFAVWVLNFMDYFGWLPRKLTKLSPFHGSFAITSMGSLGIPPIYHHLYNFGNIPVFLALGSRRTVNELNKDGSVDEVRYIDYKLTCDERIADGHAYAAALKTYKKILHNPECLDSKPEEIVSDIY